MVFLLLYFFHGDTETQLWWWCSCKIT